MSRYLRITLLASFLPLLACALPTAEECDPTVGAMEWTHMQGCLIANEANFEHNWVGRKVRLSGRVSVVRNTNSDDGAQPVIYIRQYGVRAQPSMDSVLCAAYDHYSARRLERRTDVTVYGLGATKNGKFWILGCRLFSYEG